MPFAPGQSGNPRGRPLGSKNNGLVLRRALGKLTRNGEETARFFVDVMNGHIEGAKVADRVKAAEWIAKWQFGSAPDTSIDDGRKGSGDEDNVPDEIAKLLQFPGADPIDGGESGPATDGAGEKDP